MADPRARAPKKLIEVALPLDAINTAAAREKSIRHGHPSTLHLWWARRPLAAARAVLFAQLVNDPGGERGWGNYKGQTKEDAERERQRLFGIIERLVQWENSDNQDVLDQARAEIRKSWRETCALEGNKGKPGFDPDKLPPFHDPFAGGGSIPLEAQRLGLEAHASDLNPVAVLINKAMIEIPPRFAGRPPVGPVPADQPQARHARTEDWSGARGLAEDVRRYGAWMRGEAEKRIGHLYPKVTITRDMAAERPDLDKYVGRELTVIAWLWARTVASPDPALGGVHVPLVSSFWLGKKKGKEAWIEPVVEGTTYRFRVRRGVKGKVSAPDIVETVNRKGATCLLSGSSMSFKYIREEGKQGRMQTRLFAIVAEGDRERLYLDPMPEMDAIARNVQVGWKPDAALPNNPRDFKTPNYGMGTFGDLFTPRQLVALDTLGDLIAETRTRVVEDAKRAGWADDEASIFGDIICVYLAMGLDKLADAQSSLCRWKSSMDQTIATFGRQALPMVWDFAESNVFGGMAGDYGVSLRNMMKVLERLGQGKAGVVLQADAKHSIFMDRIISTDPPYYDNIGYADLSDFFYVWLRRCLKDIFPDLFSTLLVPKADELVATPYRHGGKEQAERFFLDGMTQAMRNMAEAGHSMFPVTIYYAFKQSETKNGGTASTGWETFLEAVRDAGFAITGTWPMRTELGNRMISAGANALASSIVLVCRKRADDAPEVSRRQFLRQLEAELPEALETMIGGKEGASPIAPVDLAQAAIGPGMAIFSRYSAVLEADGTPMSVHAALIHINKAIDLYFAGVEGAMDQDTRFCLDWFQQHGFEPGKFGDADTIARAKGVSVDGVAQAGVIASGKGSVRLLRVPEYPADWDPATDTRVPDWEACHQLCRALEQSEATAGALLARMPARQTAIRQLAYRLYTVCERNKWAAEALLYNQLITSWSAIVDHSRHAGHLHEQTTLDL